MGITETDRTRRHHGENTVHSVAEFEITRKISAVAACCSRASANSALPQI